MSMSSEFKYIRRSQSQLLVFTQSLLTILGASIAILTWSHLPSRALTISEGATLSAGVLTLSAALWLRKSWSELLALRLFILNLLPVYPLMWNACLVQSRQGHFWVPFEPNTLSAMTIAILAPMQPWVGVSAIVGFIGMASVQYYLFSEEVYQLIPSNTLASLVAHGTFSAMLLLYRIHSRARTEQLAQLSEREIATRRVMRALLSMKDFINSPVQTLLIDAELLRNRFPEANDISSRMTRCSQKIAQINEVIAEHSKDLSHSPDDVSLG